MQLIHYSKADSVIRREETRHDSGTPSSGTRFAGVAMAVLRLLIPIAGRFARLTEPATTAYYSRTLFGETRANIDR